MLTRRRPAPPGALRVDEQAENSRCPLSRADRPGASSRPRAMAAFASAAALGSVGFERGPACATASRDQANGGAAEGATLPAPGLAESSRSTAAAIGIARHARRSGEPITANRSAQRDHRLVALGGRLRSAAGPGRRLTTASRKRRGTLPVAPVLRSEHQGVQPIKGYAPLRLLQQTPYR